MQKTLIAAALALAAGCATPSQLKCETFRASFNDSVDALNTCSERLSVHGDASVCEAPTAQVVKTAPMLVSSCGESAQETLAKAAKK